MYPGDASSIGFDAAAVVMTDSGAKQTWGELDERSRRLAQFWRAQGLVIGDHVALLMENVIEFPEVCWAAQRSGLMYTPINSHLTVDEVAYILRDCGARSLITTTALSTVAREALQDCPLVETVLCIGGAHGLDEYDSALAKSSAVLLDVKRRGRRCCIRRARLEFRRGCSAR